MDLFACQACGQRVYFENRHCNACGHALGFLPEQGTLSVVEPADAGGGPGVLRALAAPGRLFRACVNATSDACNWLVADETHAIFCAACRHNRVIPDLSQDESMARWRKLEVAKHRLFYTLLRLRLPLVTRAEAPDSGLAFDFLADPPEHVLGADGRPARVLTGQDDGVITLAVKEADDAERERLRVAMGEPYRTLLGHFRHEVGHYFWDVLVKRGGHLDECRALFGDDRADYDAALARHYRDGAPADWQASHISAYATAHPWEDFAETWAHYLHIVDTLHTARAFGMDLRPRQGDADLADMPDPHEAADLAPIVAAWVPLTFAMNNLSRSMGQADLYPFVLSPAVVRKLGFIHGLVHGVAGGFAPRHPPPGGAASWTSAGD